MTIGANERTQFCYEIKFVTKFFLENIANYAQNFNCIYNMFPLVKWMSLYSNKEL